MLKKPTKFESVPFFWTVLLGKSIRYTGRTFIEKKNYIRIVLINFKVKFLPPFFIIIIIMKGYGEGYTEIIYKGNVEERKFLAFYIK